MHEPVLSVNEYKIIQLQPNIFVFSFLPYEYRILHFNLYLLLTLKNLADFFSLVDVSFTF
jgi:hypothetical protein